MFILYLILMLKLLFYEFLKFLIKIENKEYMYINSKIMYFIVKSK